MPLFALSEGPMWTLGLMCRQGKIQQVREKYTSVISAGSSVHTHGTRVHDTSLWMVSSTSTETAHLIFIPTPAILNNISFSVTIHLSLFILATHMIDSAGLLSLFTKAYTNWVSARIKSKYDRQYMLTKRGLPSSSLSRWGSQWGSKGILLHCDFFSMHNYMFLLLYHL